MELRVCDAIPLIDDAIILHLPSATAEMYCSADLIGVNYPRSVNAGRIVTPFRRASSKAVISFQPSLTRSSVVARARARPSASLATGEGRGA